MKETVLFHNHVSISIFNQPATHNICKFKNFGIIVVELLIVKHLIVGDEMFKCKNDKLDFKSGIEK